jgi:hypothetical protein
MSNTETLIKCTHPPCQCLVEPEQRFCSVACSSADGSSRGPCRCGHEGCIAAERLMENEFDPHSRDSR